MTDYMRQSKFLGRQQLQSVQGAATSQAMLLRQIDDLETQDDLDPILSAGVTQAVRSQIATTDVQARQQAGLGGRVNPYAALGALSQGLLQREQMRVKNQLARQSMIQQQTGILVQQTQAGFKGAPIDALISADATIRAAEIQAASMKRNEWLSAAAGVAGGLMSSGFGTALGAAIF
jgi:hypothetical protein